MRRNAISASSCSISPFPSSPTLALSTYYTAVEMLLRALPQLTTILLCSNLVLSARNGQPEGEGTTHIDGVPIDRIPVGPSAQKVTPFAQVVSDRTGWTATADSSQPGNDAQNVLDGNADSVWHTAFTDAPLPHQITIDMQTSRYVNALTYQPRQDGSFNGNIGEHKIYLSNDGVNWGNPLAIGTYLNDATTKRTVFANTFARYVRLFAITEVNGNPWTSAAEINVEEAPGPAPGGGGVGSWGPTIDFPLVPVAVALLPGGKVLTWSSYDGSYFTGSPGGKTVTATYDPNTQIVSQRIITNTNHDMFCPGLSIDFGGRIVVTGGNDAPRTSIYDPGADNWISGPNMVISRGYQAQATISDGRTFVIGGSWSGGQGNKNGEIYDPNSNTWTGLPGCPVAPMLTNDVDGIFRSDNHGWLFGWKDGSVFQAGPSVNLNWYGTGGGGSQAGAGTRAGDADAMNGNAVLYDAVAGKILAVGGAPNYQGAPAATANAHIITIDAPFQQVTSQTINPMYYQRAFHNSVVLPNGDVFITGGQVNPAPFSDDSAQFTSEIWNHVNNQFTKTSVQSVPRTYHSTAILLPDATVFTGGGGLCGNCATNHYDAQIFSPPYLYNGDGSFRGRPGITDAPGTAGVGTTLTVSADTAITEWSLIRFGSATHTVDTDQRRVTTQITGNNGNTYNILLPNDAGVLIPGPYLLFAIDGAGTPSTARTVQITP